MLNSSGKRVLWVLIYHSPGTNRIVASAGNEAPTSTSIAFSNPKQTGQVVCFKQSAAEMKICDREAFFPRQSRQFIDPNRSPHFSTASQSLDIEMLTARESVLETPIRVVKPQEPASTSTSVIEFTPHSSNFKPEDFYRTQNIRFNCHNRQSPGWLFASYKDDSLELQVTLRSLS